MVRHIVCIKLKDFAEGASKAENARMLRQRLEAMRGRVPGLLDLEVGLNFEPSEAAYDLAERSLYESLMTRGRQSTVLEWLARLPADEVDRRPRLLLAAAWSLALSERHEEANRFIDRILAQPAVDEALRCECALIQSGAAVYADDPDNLLTTGRETATRTSDGPIDGADAWWNFGLGLTFLTESSTADPDGDGLTGPVGRCLPGHLPDRRHPVLRHHPGANRHAVLSVVSGVSGAVKAGPL